MSALRRLLSIAAIATGSRGTSPSEAAELASKDEAAALNPPEVEPVGGDLATPREDPKPQSPDAR